MKTNTKNEIASRVRFHHQLVAEVATLFLLLPLAVWAGGDVTNCTEANLRAALEGGGLVTFTCDGTIALSNTITNTENTVLDATGHRVVVSGNNAVRVFYISPDVTLTLINLSVADGRPATLAIWPAEGGGILNLGNLNATNCTFRENLARANGGTYPDGGGPAYGGAILNANGGSFNASHCSFLLNRAAAGSGTIGFDGAWAVSPTHGSYGGPARGGAIYNAGTMTIESCLFASNSVAGGDGGRGGNGGSIPYGSPAMQTGGSGGKDGEAKGAAIFNADTAFLVNCTFVSNSGNGGGGGSGGAAGVWWTSHWAVGFYGGRGGDGGLAFGGIADGDDLIRTLRMTNCTVAWNSVPGGAGGAGGTGSVSQPNGSPGDHGAAGGGVSLNGGLLVNVLLATNTPGGNCSGSYTDAGHNLSSEASCTFTNIGSMANTDPKLSPLADNGGPTLTMALQPGSPAIDAGDTAASPAADQRGFPRPFALAADIGAYEYTTSLRIVLGGEGGIDLIVHEGRVGQSCRLLAGATLSDWQCVATNQIGLDGTTTFHDSFRTGEFLRFYKVVSP